GFDGVGIEAVAARAGVGKTTIYRRWPSKEALVVASVEASFRSDDPPIDTGSVAGDLAAMAMRAQRFMARDLSGKIFPQMVHHVAAGTDLGRLYYEEVLVPKRRRLVEVLERGVARGELRAGIDFEAAADALLGTVIFLRLSGRLSELDAEGLAGVIGQVVTGLRPAS
ncbi:MAG: TetR/AcrR family transcriptional regulator, partial [Actinomycetota bacterium]